MVNNTIRLLLLKYSFYNNINQDNKIGSLVSSICFGNICNSINLDSNTIISSNVSCFLYLKSVNNLEILVSLFYKWSNNSSLLFSTSSFNLSISFIFTFANNLNSLSFSKSCGFLQNLLFSS